MEVLKEAIKKFLAVDVGDGRGNGSGDGWGNGSGNGRGNGRGDGLISFDGQDVHYIDGMPTVIKQVRGNLAKGFTINNDLTTSPCYIVKSRNLFAHGSTLKEAQKSLQDKIFDNMDIDEKIDMFLEQFNTTDKYPAKAFYDWHNKLTGSCAFGRDSFCRNHGIDLENGMYTVKEFIEITENDYGSSVIKQLKEKIEEM
jgi:hypothetical protein